MIPQAQLRPGKDFVPTQAAGYYVQRLVTNLTARRCIIGALATGVRLRHGTLATGQEADLRDVVSELRQDGIAMLPDLFSASQLSDVVDHFRSQPLAHRTKTTAAYSLESIVACPGLMEAVNRPDILRLASAFIGCKPTLQALGVRWSYPGKASADVQSFHRDPDDWRFLKLFVYLTDVDEESGPHVYVAGTHRTRRPWQARTYAQSEIENRYGAKVRAILGATGTTFAADTNGIHAGIPPKRTPRLLLQAQYSILPNYALRYRPVADRTHPGLDPYVNRLMVARTTG